jgi:glucose 1-dehydrogenase
MRKLLANQKALVTGASSGIGYGIARAMADAGAAVAINYHSQRDEAEELVETIRTAGGEAIALKADVSKEEEVERLFGHSIADFGTLDILVANAGIQRDAPLAEMSLADWRKVLEVNLGGQFLCAKRAVAEFLRRGSVPEVSRATGKIICISSVHDVIPWAGHINYAASKGGIQMMMKSLAQEVAHHRIRVNAIAPGAIRTAINEAAWSTPAAEQKLLELIPYGRVGEVEDVAKAAVWLASDEADYVTGTTLYIDGGMMLYPGFRDNG